MFISNHLASHFKLIIPKLITTHDKSIIRCHWSPSFHCMVCRTPKISTVSVYARSGAVLTVTSTCRWLLWSACSTRPPAGQLEKSSRQKKVRKHLHSYLLWGIFWWVWLGTWNLKYMNNFSLTVSMCCGFQSQEVEKRVPPPRCPVLPEFITVMSVMKTWTSPPPRSSNIKGSTCFLLTEHSI